MNIPEPAQPRWLTELLARTDRQAALWETIERTPILGEQREGLTEVTFAVRQPRTDNEIVVHTAALNHDLDAGRLHYEPGTDLWHRSWWLPTDGTWAYRILQVPATKLTQQDRHALHAAGARDPLNPSWQPHALGSVSSVLVMPQAYQHPAWGPTPSTERAVQIADVEPVEGERRSVRIATTAIV